MLGTFFHHYLQDLSATLGETSHFAVREGVEVFFIDHHMPTGQVVSVAGQTGEFAPLHCTAHGKALLADCDLHALARAARAGAAARLHAHDRAVGDASRASSARRFASTDSRSTRGKYLDEVDLRGRADPRSEGEHRRVGRHLVARSARLHTRGDRRDDRAPKSASDRPDGAITRRSLGALSDARGRATVVATLSSATSFVAPCATHRAARL